MPNRDREIVLNFLNSNFSTRQLDRILGYNPQKSKGWISWKILKSYNLHAGDRGKLFCFRKQQSLRIIGQLMKVRTRKEVGEILRKAEPEFFEKYRGTHIIAESDEKVSIVLSGEVRNITQSFFKPLKKSVGVCQFPKCDREDLDTVHLLKSRPEILKLSIEYGKDLETNKYNVYEVLRHYIYLHSKRKSLCFLCKKHHEELGVLERNRGEGLRVFRDKVVLD